MRDVNIWMNEGMEKKSLPFFSFFVFVFVFVFCFVLMMECDIPTIFFFPFFEFLESDFRGGIFFDFVACPEDPASDGTED
tara:strand:+ start:2343 stop:2582 length:240 start_codon:yes stop_codon:yes gene_type:complete